jgi:hypothetical protein
MMVNFYTNVLKTQKMQMTQFLKSPSGEDYEILVVQLCGHPHSDSQNHPQLSVFS